MRDELAGTGIIQELTESQLLMGGLTGANLRLAPVCSFSYRKRKSGCCL